MRAGPRPSPPPDFTTERLLLRRPSPRDAQELHAAITESLPSLQRWMPWVQVPPTVDEVRVEARRARARFGRCSSLRFHIFLAGRSEIIGTCGVNWFDWRVPMCEVGYWCRTSREGQGLMTEALHGLVRYCFVELRLVRVQLRCDQRNARSRALAERCGFAFEGLMHHDCRDTQGDLRDTRLYAITRDRWAGDTE